MTSSQQDESIYLEPLIQYGPDSTSGSGSQLAGTSLTGSDMFVDFPMGPLTCEYSSYGWATGGSGTYEATPAACQPPSKSEIPEGEGYLQRATHLMSLQSSFADDCTFPDDVPTFTSRPDLFSRQATPHTHITVDGRGPSDPNGSVPPPSSVNVPGSPHPNGNPSWLPWTSFDSESLPPTFPNTIDPRCTVAAPFTLVPPSSALPDHLLSTTSEATLHDMPRLETAHESLLPVPDGQSSIQTLPYANEQETIDAIRALIRLAPFMTSNPQCTEPNVGSPEDHYTGGRGIPGKSIFTAFITLLGTGEYQCIQCGNAYKKLERAIGDQAKHFGFKPYICGQKHDGKTVCPKAFGMKDYRKTHQERENKPSVQCGSCPAAIKHARNLPRHMQQVHGHSGPSTAQKKRHRLIGKEALYGTMRK